MSDDGDEGDEGDAAPSQADFDKLRKQLLETQQKLKKSSMLAKWGKTQVEQLRQQVEKKSANFKNNLTHHASAKLDHPQQLW